MDRDPELESWFDMLDEEYQREAIESALSQQFNEQGLDDDRFY